MLANGTRTAVIAKSILGTLLAASLLIGGGSSLSFAQANPPPVHVDHDHDGIDDSLEQILAEKFAPVMIIEPGDENYPVNVDWFLDRTRLKYHEACFWGDVEESLPVPPGSNPIGSQDNLIGPPWTHPGDFGENQTGGHCGGEESSHRAITTIAKDPGGEGPTGYSDRTTFYLATLDEPYRVGSLDPLDWVTYFHAYPTADGGIMIQYWHVFAYNDFPFDDHGGDWDATIHVQLDNTLNLKGVWFSRHLDFFPGTFKEPGHIPPRVQMYDSTHTIVTIDSGHGAFASAEDWCLDPNTAGVGRWGDIAWGPISGDEGDLSHSASSLHTIGCDSGTPHYKDEEGGTIWQTWTDGQVFQGGDDVRYHIVQSPSAHGGLINVGEYNPCTPQTCQGTKQASTLLAGQFLPLNGQDFIRYSGRWGDIRFISGWSGPRGPVFAGFKDGVYTAWYNQGADDPASADTSPWLTDGDQDGLITWEEEYWYGSDPDDLDSDDDYLSDGVEVKTLGTNPSWWDTDGDTISDYQEDFDEDGLFNGEEVGLYGWQTNPFDRDTDRDDLSDGDEVYIYVTDPLRKDTDEDALRDGDEVLVGAKPRVPDTDGDGLQDGVDMDPTHWSNDFKDSLMWGGFDFFLGTISVRGGVTLEVSDGPSINKVRAVVSGSGAPAVVKACPDPEVPGEFFTTYDELKPGGDFEINCPGPQAPSKDVTVYVKLGRILVTFGGRILVTFGGCGKMLCHAVLPMGTHTTFSAVASGALEVTNSLASTAPITVTFGRSPGVLPAGTYTTFSAVAPGALGVTNSLASTAPITVNGIQIPPGRIERDDDGDAFFTSQEIHVGTDAYDAGSHPLDIDGDGAFSVTGDVINYVGGIGAAPGAPNWRQRLDLDMSHDISVTGDVSMYVGRIGERCR